LGDFKVQKLKLFRKDKPQFAIVPEFISGKKLAALLATGEKGVVGDF
jgi:predicted ATP-grasp superfamily ATP-dependent carboligase